jgi:hypothetical protein
VVSVAEGGCGSIRTRERQVVEQIREHCPHVWGVVLANALVVKAVNLRDLPALMVPPNHRHTMWKPNLFYRHERKEKKRRKSEERATLVSPNRMRKPSLIVAWLGGVEVALWWWWWWWWW